MLGWFLSLKESGSWANWVWSGWVTVSFDEVLENDFRILEIGSIVIVGLSMDTDQSLFQILEPPHEFLDILVLHQILILIDEFLGSK